MPNAAIPQSHETITPEICANVRRGFLAGGRAMQPCEIPAQHHDLGDSFASDFEAESASAFGLPNTLAQGGLASWQCRALISHIEANFTRPMRIEELAELVRLSTSHFSRAFKLSFGETPYAFVLGKRIQRAKALMLSTNEPLSRIALECGLSDQAHLSNLFRKLMGIAPNAWRQNNRGGEVNTLSF